MYPRSGYFLVEHKTRYNLIFETCLYDFEFWNPMKSYWIDVLQHAYLTWKSDYKTIQLTGQSKQEQNFELHINGYTSNFGLKYLPTWYFLCLFKKFNQANLLNLTDKELSPPLFSHKCFSTFNRCASNERHSTEAIFEPCGPTKSHATCSFFAYFCCYKSLNTVLKNNAKNFEKKGKEK